MMNKAPLIRPSGTFSHKGRRGWSREFAVVPLLPSWEKVARAKRETDEGGCR